MSYEDIKLSGVKLLENGGKLYAEINQTGIEARYSIPTLKFFAPAKAVLCDLDGTTVKSEEFWIYLMEKTVAAIKGDENFCFEEEDIPFVSGYTTFQHLEYCIKKYGLNPDLAEANRTYHRIAEEELGEILEGRGNVNAFKPREGLKDFLYELKARKIKIGLVTSGLSYKAIPEIVSAFRVLKMGDPLDFYDAIITGGSRKIKGQYGTLGEIAAKHHPWVYSEVGAALTGDDKSGVVTLEDSTAGLISSLTAGYPVIGFKDGNILKSKAEVLCSSTVDTFSEVLELL